MSEYKPASLEVMPAEVIVSREAGEKRPDAERVEEPPSETTESLGQKILEIEKKADMYLGSIEATEIGLNEARTKLGLPERSETPFSIATAQAALLKLEESRNILVDRDMTIRGSETPPQSVEQHENEKAVERIQPDAFLQNLASRLSAETGKDGAIVLDYLLHGARSPETAGIVTEVDQELKKNGIEMVHIYQGLTMESGDTDRFFVTNKINGCVATVVDTAYADGRRGVSFTHFPEFMSRRNVDAYRSAAKEAGVSRSLLMMDARRTGKEGELRAGLTEAFGETQTDRVFYDTSETTKPDYGVVLVKVTADKKEPFSFHTWAKSGAIPVPLRIQ